ncbi:MAG: serine/threonine-protein kinase [Coriobacteriales bacterium]|nr:serine/threonine-protein kinase [Coriobacteriales bacterium]
MGLIESIDFSLSKEGDWEAFSLTDATFGDALEHEQAPITNEQILPKDVFLDTYVVTSEAHSGNMGSVWRVHHKDWDTDLAMKRPKPRHFAEASPERQHRFVAECENWINLGLHPHVVSCYYVRLIGGVPTVFAEWMDGGSLEDAIEGRTLYDDDEAVTQERILDIAIQVARGLQYSHACGLLHQDVKPANIMLTGAWEAKVGDFGLAKAMTDLVGDDIEGKKSGGTLAYCPREQSDGQPAEPWMDVYAWALTTLEMYAGKRLWERGSDASKNVPNLFPQCRVNVPLPVQILLVRCIAEHVGSFSEVEIELEKAYHDVVGAAYPRPMPQAATDTVESLNNRALSFLDLGKRSVAQTIWQEVLERNPDATHAIYNSELTKLIEQGEATSDVYELEAQRNELHGKVLDSSSKSETYEKDLMLVRTLLSSYSNFAEHFMKKALNLCPQDSPERPSYEELFKTIQRSWLMLPIDPRRCGNIYFDRDGDLCAICWLELVGGDSSCLNLAVCDLKDKDSLRKRRLDEFWDDRGGRYFGRLRRVYFVNGVVTLLSDGFGYAQYDPATLELVAEGDDDPPFDEPWRDDWPYTPLSDGLREVWRTNEDVLWGRLWTRPREQSGRARIWVGTPKGNERDSCLHAEFPAQGLPRGCYAVCADHEGRYLLIYHENPVTTAAAPEFYLVDTNLFGRLPDYTVAKAASYRETINAEQARNRALMHAEDALKKGDVAWALRELDDAYRLFPDEPGEVWTRLNDEVGRYTVRDALRGVRTGPGEYRIQRKHGVGREHPFEIIGGDDPMSSFLALGEEASKERLGAQNEKQWERAYRIGFEVESDAGKTVSAQDGSTFRLPPAGFHRASGAAYDSGRKLLYTCASGELCVWDVSGLEPRKTCSVRFGQTVTEDWDERLVDGLLPYDPSRRDTLWTLDPYRIILNRQQDATAILLRSKVINVYGHDRKQDLEMMTVIDLRTMAVVHSEPCHANTWVLFDGGAYVAKSLGLVGLSNDGTLMAIDHDEYGTGTAQLELWDVAEPGTFVKHIAQTFEPCKGLRGDGGALLCGDRTLHEGDVETHFFTEQLLDWRYRLPNDSELREQKLGVLQHRLQQEAEEIERRRAEREERKRELKERIAKKRGEQTQVAETPIARPEERRRNPQLEELTRKAREAREAAERRRAEQERQAARKAEQERQAAKSRLMTIIIQEDGIRNRLQLEKENIERQIEVKTSQLARLGFFQGKKKRELAAEIDKLNKRLAEIPAEMAEAEAKAAAARAELAG